MEGANKWNPGHGFAPLGAQDPRLITTAARVLCQSRPGLCPDLTSLNYDVLPPPRSCSGNHLQLRYY
jgi:hypothetical protein